VEQPLPPRGEDMNLATPDLFKPVRPDSFIAIPGLDGLEIRDLGFGELSDGAIGAQIFRATGGDVESAKMWHMHDLSYQLGYVYKGWALYEFEGIGPIRIEAGTAIYHLPRNRLRVLDRSADFEGIWIKLPARDVVTAFPFDEASQSYGEVRMTHENA
jgi:hypothetical protein